MKKLVLCLTILAFALSFSAPAFADVGEKFSEGFKRLATSPMNIPDSVKEEWDAAELKPLGAFGGMIKGLVMTGVDFIGGFWEVLTSPVPSGGE